eukprot:5167075-Pyramimonas_sp.AAC.1
MSPQVCAVVHGMSNRTGGLVECADAGAGREFQGPARRVEVLLERGQLPGASCAWCAARMVKNVLGAIGK